MRSKTSHIPKYRHHKAKNLAVVSIDGRDIYLGEFDSPVSHEKYRRTVAEWLSAKDSGPVPAPETAKGFWGVSRFIESYLKYALGKCIRTRGGTPRNTVACCRPVPHPINWACSHPFFPLHDMALEDAVVVKQKKTPR